MRKVAGFILLLLCLTRISYADMEWVKDRFSIVSGRLFFYLALTLWFMGGLLFVVSLIDAKKQSKMRKWTKYCAVGGVILMVIAVLSPLCWSYLFKISPSLRDLLVCLPKWEHGMVKEFPVKTEYSIIREECKSYCLRNYGVASFRVSVGDVWMTPEEQSYICDCDLNKCGLEVSGYSGLDVMIDYSINPDDIASLDDCEKFPQPYAFDCYGYLFSKSDDSAMCNGVSNALYRGYCDWRINKMLEERGQCNRIDDKDSRSSCYFDLAVNMSDVSMCDKIDTDSRSNCYHRLALILKNVTLCDEVGDYTGLCYFQVAVISGDPSPCEKLKSQQNKSHCYDRVYYFLAVGVNNMSICEKVTDENLRSSCHRVLAMGLNNDTVCKEMNSTDWYDFYVCRDYYFKYRIYR